MDQYAIACMTNAELIYWNSFEFLSLNLFLYDHLLIAHFFCYPFLPLVCQIWTWICLWCGGWLYSLCIQNWNEKWVLLCHSQKEDNCHLWDSRCYWSWTQQTQPNHHLKRNKNLLKHLWNTKSLQSFYVKWSLSEGLWPFSFLERYMYVYRMRSQFFIGFLIWETKRNHGRF